MISTLPTVLLLSLQQCSHHLSLSRELAALSGHFPRFPQGKETVGTRLYLYAESMLENTCNKSDQQKKKEEKNKTPEVLTLI